MATRPMQVWNGTAWEDIGPQAPPTAIVVQSSAPTGDSGKLWIDTSADVPTYANMAPTASPSFTGTSTFAGPVTMSGGAVSMSGATSVTGGGMDLITPTSVAGSGVTLSGGEVSFSASTTISINGCFTTAYDNYLVQARYVAAAGTPSVNLRMRNAGVDASGAGTYFYQRLTSAAASVASSQVTDSQARTCDASTLQNVSITEFFGPALAVTTTGKNRGTYSSSTSGIQMNFHDFGHNVATAHDGFSFYPATSSLTGTLRIYGLRNS